jgi:hypothetical protein
MESKLVTVEVMVNHPKLMRLPSVSRSLYFSIMPQSCYEMYAKPAILTLKPKSVINATPPVFSSYRSQRKKRKVSYEPRPITKPCPNSYVYNKMFNPKPQISGPKMPHKPPRPRPNTTQNQRSITFYCEVNPPKSAPKRSELPKNLNFTLMELGDIENSLKKSPSRSLLNKNMVDKEMGMDIKMSQESIEDLHKISEVHSSMEISVESYDDQKSKSFANI